MNWLIRIAYSWPIKLAYLDDETLTEEVFIDDTGFVYHADGDMGDANHDIVVLQTVLGLLDEFEELESLEIDSLDEQQRQVVEANYPGFVEYVLKGGLPKEYAVLKMGWIRVLDDYFEVGTLNEGALNRIADYASEATLNNIKTTLRIADRSTNALEHFTLGELVEALHAGYGMQAYRLKTMESERATRLRLY